MMPGLEVKKETIDGVIRLTSGNCTFIFRRPHPGILHVAIIGLDNGQFGTATLDEVRAEIGRHSPVEMFIDTRGAVRAAVSVSDEWTRFFSKHKSDLSRVHILVGSKILHLTVSIAQHLSRTGGLIRIYSNPDHFEAVAGTAANPR